MKKYMMMTGASLILLGASINTADAQRYYRPQQRTVKEVSKVKKQGLSRKAQGAILGGVGGAALGYVIDGSTKGAVIGGLLGAGGGFLYGQHRDNVMPDNRPTVYKYKRVVR